MGSEMCKIDPYWTLYIPVVISSKMCNMRLLLAIFTQLIGVQVFQTNFMPFLCATKSKTQKHKENQEKNTMNKTLQNCGKKNGNGRIYLKVKENRLTYLLIVCCKSQTITRVS